MKLTLLHLILSVDISAFQLMVHLCLFTVSCPTEAPVLPIVLGVVGGILFLGLLILIVIKALFTMVVSEGYFFSFVLIMTDLRST